MSDVLRATFPSRGKVHYEMVWERHELEVFLTLAKELHFGRTAERLYVTTGLVSKTIKKLELRIGTPLFDRSSRAVHLTPSGRRLADDLNPVYMQLDRIMARAVDDAHGLTGLLRVGYSAPWNGDLLLAAGRIRSTATICWRPRSSRSQATSRSTGSTTTIPAQRSTAHPSSAAPQAAYWQEVLALVASGQGVSITCSRAAVYYAHPDITYVPFRDPPTVDYGLLWLRSARAHRLRAFAEVVQETACRKEDTS